MWYAYVKKILLKVYLLDSKNNGRFVSFRDISNIKERGKKKIKQRISKISTFNLTIHTKLKI